MLHDLCKFKASISIATMVTNFCEDTFEHAVTANPSGCYFPVILNTKDNVLCRYSENYIQSYYSN